MRLNVKNYYCCRSFILTFLLAITQWLCGQQINLRFQHITTDEGLSQNTISSILRDERGFMWFASMNGLNRYDGYGFLVYKNGNGISDLSDNFIFSIAEDKSGDIWVGTEHGINKLNFSKNTVEKFFHKNHNDSTIAGNKINVIYCDKKGRIWIGIANCGLDCIEDYQPGQQYFHIRHFRNNPICAKSIPSNEVKTICEDSRGNIWVGTNKGLACYNSQRRNFEVYHASAAINSLSYDNVLSIFEDRSKNIWVGTEFGLNRFDPNTKLFQRYLNNPDDPNSLSHSTIRAITEDPNGNLLLGTLGGLNRFDQHGKKFIRYPVNQNNDYSLNNEFINVLVADKEGNVWIGTDKGGVNSFNIYQKQFGYFAHNPANANSISHNTINSVFEERDVLWIGTAGGGLNRYDRNSGTFKVFKTDSHNNKGISSNFITSLIRNQKGTLLAASWGGGLNLLVSDNGSGTFKHFRHDDNDSSSLCNDFVSSLLEDTDGKILLGTQGGLGVYDPHMEKFRHIEVNPVSPLNTKIGCLLKDKKGNYWIGTETALYRMHADGHSFNAKKIDRITNIPGDLNSLAGNYVISLHEDLEGNIWAGTYGNGISKISLVGTDSLSFQNFSMHDGLSNNVAYAILEDKNGNIWISTDNGLSRYDIRQKRFSCFYITDGLQSNQFYWSAGFKSIDGKMFFGGMKGLNFFYPEGLMDNNLPQHVSITDLKIFNSSVNIGAWNNKKTILKEVISQTKDIKLSYKENVFSIEFSALSYYLPEKIQYAYKMVGVDQDWVYVTSSRRFASYTNLKGGHYSFLVKASNMGTNWSEPTKLDIYITPPFYYTIWFKITSVLFIVAAVLFYLSYRTRKLHSQKRKLEKKVIERTALIEAQKQQLEEQAVHLNDSNHQLARRQELIEGQKSQLELQNKEISEQRDKLIELNKRVQLANQLKLRFFTNISHEFRTPLTLILGPIEKLIQNWKGDDESRESFMLINRNAQRLLHLINQLMEFRKVETGKLDLKVAPDNLARFVNNIFESFALLADQRKINYVLHTPDVSGIQWFDPEKLENIIYNLISNAFKYTPEQGKITVSIKFTEKTDRVIDERHTKLHEMMAEITVTDTGIGISSEHINDIFKRFYRVTTPENLKINGSGIGLSLTRELVKAHRGHISVQSEEGQGSSFTVLIPFEKEKYALSELMEEIPVVPGNLQFQVDNLTKELVNSDRIHEQQNGGMVKPGQGIKPLVLVVEDNYDLRNFIVNNLFDEYRIIEAGNGKEAYEMAKLQTPELIISDIMMPEMDGLELCSRVKNNLITSHIPVILLTARSSVEHWIEGLETGADDYVPKPFNITILKARIKNFILQRKKLRSIFSRELNPDPSEIATTTADEQFLKKAMQIVELNFKDAEFGVEDFVSKMNMSRSLLHKKLTVITDLSAGDFISSIRLKKSAQLLKYSDKNVSEVAYEVGFNDPKYFSRIFRKHFGVPPSEFVEH